MLWIKILTAAIAVEHIGFLIIEMFAWEKFGQGAFKERFVANDEAAAALAGNMGLYNGFLAAGLIWGLKSPEPERLRILMFFLICIVVAGLYGGYSVRPLVLLAQALPAAVALALWWMAKPQSVQGRGTN